MLRWFLLFIFGATTLASCWFFVPSAGTPTPNAVSLNPLTESLPVFSLSRSEVDSVVVNLHDGRYLDLLKMGDGVWRDIRTGRTMPTEWAERLLDLVIDLDVQHVTVGWNEDRYRSDGMALSVSLRGEEGPPQSIWFGSLEPASGRASTEIEQKWQAVRIGPEKETPSHALPPGISREILTWVTPQMPKPVPVGH